MNDYRVTRLTTEEDCESFAVNVEKEHPALAKEARRRAVELRAAAYGANSDAERDSLRAVCAFEDIKRRQTGRKFRSVRTWESIKRNGVIRTVENIVTRSAPTEGYGALVEAGMEDFTFEAVVLRHETDFSAAAIEHARRRIERRAAS